MCAITISPRFTWRKTLDIIFHIWAIPDISIIFCRTGSVGAGVPRGFRQLIKVLRKETGQAIRGPVGAQQQLHSSTGQSFHFWIWIEGSIQSLDGWPHPLFCRCPAKKVRWAECREKAASRACLSVSVLAEEKIRFSRMSSCSREGGREAGQLGPIVVTNCENSPPVVSSVRRCAPTELQPDKLLQMGGNSVSIELCDCFEKCPHQGRLMTRYISS